MHIYIYTHEPSEHSPAKIKYIWQKKEIKNYIYQLRTKLKQGAIGEYSNENKISKYVERKG